MKRNYKLVAIIVAAVVLLFLVDSTLPVNVDDRTPDARWKIPYVLGRLGAALAEFRAVKGGNPASLDVLAEEKFLRDPFTLEVIRNGKPEFAYYSRVRPDHPSGLALVVCEEVVRITFRSPDGALSEQQQRYVLTNDLRESAVSAREMTGYLKRQMAAQYNLSLGPDALEDWLSRRLGDVVDARDLPAVHAALFRLGELERGRPLLEKALGSPVNSVRFEAARALSETGSPDAVEILVKSITDAAFWQNNRVVMLRDRYHRRLQAVRALRQSGMDLKNALPEMDPGLLADALMPDQ